MAFDYRSGFSNYLPLQLRPNPITEANWVVAQGSILDSEFVASLEPADVVYSWGVLTFTGDMWKAIDMTASLVKPNGLLAIAVYNQTSTSPMWLQVKKLYKGSHPLIQLRWCGAYFYLAQLFGPS